MRKQLGAPDENRKKATRLFDAEEVEDYDVSEPDFEPVDVNDGLRVRSKSKKSEKTAESVALKLLSMKTYTERGLREKLKMKGYGLDEIDEAVEKMRGFGYINDARIAQNTAEKLSAKLWGRRKIVMYLASKGISRDIIDEIDFSEIDFKENCRTLAQKYAAKGSSNEKIAAALSRAGYSSSEIYFAISVIQ
jgi:regulatory protein